MEYYPQDGVRWINENFNKDEDLIIKKTFYLTNQDMIPTDDSPDGDSMEFLIGELENDYYKIYKRVLAADNDILFHKSIDIRIKHFIVNSNISVLLKFERLAGQQIIIGGDKENAVAENIFNDIINSFPSRTEQNHYVNSRVTNVLSQYLDGVKDSGKAFERYLERRNKIGNLNTLSSIRNYEYEKYLFILAALKKMLADSENFSEKDWQNQIIEIILIIYPKYIKCFSEVAIKDYYTNPSKPTTRSLDLMLIDANGTVDVIEIKKPFNNCVVTKRTYRDNYTPMKELSGTVMQVEKYLFHLNKWGAQGEQVLNQKYQHDIPSGMRIKITNPKGLIILGRNDNLCDEQLFDFEIIKRKYSNVMDIITYDDLINRLENILQKFKNDCT
ncbi:Shedu immune nuclease family protein [Flavobacterium sp. CF136]|uniref:Shedu immune nuclease family protein n=1 Tax=Flavobacterium sp. (strain CF136) TaxID=1144313 RepID=UPI0002718E3E|nr:Shedu immune nuclease family protein [Flavobacterium sp. CF136]EJL62807.1 hypothetical protein PMI10_02764 [Flavobacterium sp. CF136]